MFLEAPFKASTSMREKNWPHRWSTDKCYGSKAVSIAFATVQVEAADAAAVIDVVEAGLSMDKAKVKSVIDDTSDDNLSLIA